MRRRSFPPGALGAGAAPGPAPLLTSCSQGTSGSGTLPPGSDASDAVPKKATAAQMAAFEAATDRTVGIDTIDHNTFQEDINNYLQGRPDDVFTWLSGYRMRLSAAQGPAEGIGDVRDGPDGFTEAFKQASTGDDGAQYLVPVSHRPPGPSSTANQCGKTSGCTVPRTLDDLTALCGRRAKDGLAPIAFADKDGWPAMGTFDILNLRIDGYQFHVDLMAGRKERNSPRARAVLDTGTGLPPHHQSDSPGRTWQEAAQSLQREKSGTYLTGLFVAQRFRGADQQDLDFLPFPETTPPWGATHPTRPSTAGRCRHARRTNWAPRNSRPPSEANSPRTS